MVILGVQRLSDSETAMKQDTRACVAYAALRLISGSPATAVYDHASECYLSMAGEISATSVDLYDYSRQAHFGGRGADGIYDLYDHGHGHYVRLEIKGKRYSGYDHGSGCHFSGLVEGTRTALYDYAKAVRFHYSL